MTRRRRLIHAVFLFLLPLIVAAFGVGVFTAALLVIAMLLWRWMIVLSGIMAPEKAPPLELETIEISHYVEKVRWCMDRLGLDYRERYTAGVLGVFFIGRTVPKLRVRTGLVESTIGNSPEILRYLWGAYAAPLGSKAAFLEPTAERLELEQRIDRYGRNLQVWIYNELFRSKDQTLRAWGAESRNVPGWQKAALRVLHPILVVLMRRAFRLSQEHAARATGHIEEMLSEVDALLSDGRGSILGGDEINFTDIAFAALSAAWLQPERFAAGKCADVRLDMERVPPKLREDIARWREDFPRAAAFAERLYEEER